MKFVIIGLGNFGASLAEKLTQAGNEVIGVDKNMNKVEAFKERITHTICIDCKDELAVSVLPLKNTDVVIVCIGEDEGANLMTTALMKKLNVKRLISRAVSPLHENVLEAMGIEEIIHPEEEAAERWAKSITIEGVVDSFMLSSEYGIIEATVPEKYVGLTLFETGIRKALEIIVMTTIKTKVGRNLIGVEKKSKVIQGVASARTKLESGDILVMYGKLKDIKEFLKG